MNRMLPPVTGRRTSPAAIDTPPAVFIHRPRREDRARSGSSQELAAACQIDVQDVVYVHLHVKLERNPV